MSNKGGRSVYQRQDGDWVNIRNDADRAGSIHMTQKEAWDTAKQMLQHQGGGELTVMGVHGKIVSKDTISPTHDPNPPKIQIISAHRGTSKTQHVIRHANGQWSVRRSGSSKPSRTFDRQSDAVNYAREVARRKSGELLIHGGDGRIQERRSYARDPSPSRDK